MLAKHTIINTIAVNDIENAVDFYGGVLGLERLENNAAGALFASEGGVIEATVIGLKARGVVFDQNYDLPETQQEDDIYILGETQKAAWFRDPDGNILGLGNF